ncbi:hypothetical protein [Actinotalea sp. C106]|uniref:hypothetical protein n=1 Tax=Actinotalea sp. C106 TaxID=2908644 RepID=UPI002027C799|nr:hypothetical protein [Actinotalea sp. C106]
MGSGFSLDPAALAGVVAQLRSQADSTGGLALPAGPDVGRSTDETRTAVTALTGALEDMTESLSALADTLQATIDDYQADDGATASSLSGTGQGMQVR